jgi:hypothetical protein
LSHFLHDFPPNHSKYLPLFDEEPNTLIVEKHVQAFEHFLDLLEVEYVVVCMRYFSQSLQGDAKILLMHLQPKSISSWDELRETFLKF